MMNDLLVDLVGVRAQVKVGRHDLLTTVDEVNLQLTRGSSNAIVGKSGSGKTSLVSIVGLLNASFTGTYRYAGKDVSDLVDRQRSILRGRHIGFVFQNYSLIRHLNVFENVDLALHYGGGAHHGKQQVMAALAAVGLEERVKDFPGMLSGGEQQRVAIARSLVTEPELLICDEPTGALDTETGLLVLDLLMERVSKLGTTLLMVTHDQDVARRCEKVFHMEKGRLIDA